ncbi:hypothetical protein CDAR_62451 [Caerostris darwini]|uniref:Uncharacterized protein n=1 Tax=Caerostris darwini TaxID=1538125 RepID=A0AAV4UF55_9ARAC|nr:hypothetical protein CDAR_62451 [Caerostris darwini]
MSGVFIPPQFQKLINESVCQPFFQLEHSTPFHPNFGSIFFARDIFPPRTKNTFCPSTTEGDISGVRFSPQPVSPPPCVQRRVGGQQWNSWRDVIPPEIASSSRGNEERGQGTGGDVHLF